MQLQHCLTVALVLEATCVYFDSSNTAFSSNTDGRKTTAGTGASPSNNCSASVSI